MSDGQLDALAFLLTPPGRLPDLVDAGKRWHVDATPESWRPTVLWGHAPAGRSTPTAQLLVAAVRREMALRRVGRSAGAGGHVVHRLAPSAKARGRATERLLRALPSGVVVELAGSPDGRVIDLVAGAAGVPVPVHSFRLGVGGQMLAAVEARDGVAAMLRVAPLGAPGNPRRAADALRRLAGVPKVPALLAEGVTAGAAWTLESLLSGRPAQGRRHLLFDDVSAFCSSLPRRGHAQAHRADLGVIAAALPGYADCLADVARRIDDAFAGVRAVQRHGDLWAGNLLVEDGHVSGIVDWDAAHPDGVPGADLFKLFATEARRRTRLPVGAFWVSEPWRRPLFGQLSAAYWEAMGVRLTPPRAAAVAAAWWAAEVAGSMTRVPSCATDPRWVGGNVDPVMDRLSAPLPRRRASASAE